MVVGSTRESGLGLIELFLGSSVLAIAVLGTISGVMSSLKIAIDTKDTNVSNDRAISVVEQFRRACTNDFDAALVEYAGRTVRVGNRSVQTDIILDETRFSPAVDLNGDGDTNDTTLTPAEVNAAYIETVVRWGRDKSLSFVATIARLSVTAGRGGSGGGGGSGGSGSFTLIGGSVIGDTITMKIDSGGTAIPIVGITVDGKAGNYIEEVLNGGTKVFSDRSNAIAMGGLIPTTTFIVDGTAALSFRAQTAANGGAQSKLDGQGFDITLHLESGVTSILRVE